MDNQITLRRLAPEDVDAFRDLRLEALRLTPRAFGHTLADERERQRSYFEFLVNANIILGMFDGDRLIGCVILTPFTEPKMQHKGTVWGAYVKPEYRNLYLAKRMLLRLFEIAKMLGMRHVLSSIFASNTVAVESQKVVGYVEMYREKDGVRHLDGTFDDIVYFIRYL